MTRLDRRRTRTSHGLGDTASSASDLECVAGATLVSRYRLDAPIGEGGMSTVWRALDLATGTPVAIKLALLDEHLEETTVRMRVEARLEAELVHPGIVRSLGHGCTGRGRAFLVLELLEGWSLRQILELHGALVPVFAVRVLLPVADALSFVHERGVIHRDLKPDNVFITREGGALRPKLIDFGIAKAAGSEHCTVRRAVIGTPGYMAPEQAYGSREVDHRVDIWAFCALLREVIGHGTSSGDPDARTRRCGRAAVFDTGVAPRAFDAERELWAILDRGLALDRDRRFSSMHQLAQALTGWLLAQGVGDDVCGNRLRASSLAATSPRPSLQAPVRDDSGFRRKRRHVVYRAAQAADRA
jgi:serine/threonine-protein kinase